MQFVLVKVLRRYLSYNIVTDKKKSTFTKVLQFHLKDTFCTKMGIKKV